MINFALIGTGDIAREHAKAIQSTKGCKLMAVASSDEERARSFAKEFGIPNHATCKEILGDNKIDVVDIVTINNLHAEFGIMAAKNGKHIIVEKPIDVSIKKAQELIDTCRKMGVKLSVISQFRFDPEIQKIKTMIENNELGKLIMGNAAVMLSRGEDYYKKKWRASKEQAGGGVLILQAIHHLDLLLWLFGDVESAYGTMSNIRHKMEVEDTVSATIKFKSGAIATLNTTTSMPKSLEDRLEVHGTEKSVSLSIFKKGMFSAKGTIKSQIENFINAINNSSYGKNVEPMVTGEDGLKTLKVIKSIYSSGGER